MKDLTLFAAVGLLTLLLTGCGASKTSNFVETSRGVDPGVNYGNNYLLGECNRVKMPTMSLTGQIGTYYDALTMKYSADKLTLNLTSVPAEIYTSSTLQFKFYRWFERVGGSKQLNTLPVRFQFFDKLTGTKTPANGVDNLSKATMNAARAAFGSSWLNVKTNEFFERTQILLTGVDMQYDAITIAMYDTSSGQNSAVSQGDILLPPFYSNPNVYRQITPVPNLYNLHPNIALTGSNSSERDYHQLIEDICHELAGIGARIPASAQEPKSITQKIWGRILDSLESVLGFHLTF
ncbi:MAG: hypothetical protein KDD38_01450 [Bdellovibrionales bacterium]|nr:hypothetical protein [Bdellovibrionales bacterium]